MRQDFLSPRAHKHIIKLLSTKEEDSVFRICIDAGGCNGFQYQFRVDPHASDEDLIIEQEGVKIAIDTVSQPFLENAQIDYVEDLIGSYFKVNNPDAASSCGCGSSFSV
jgi:iron-sulfur cluster assembly accessory protein